MLETGIGDRFGSGRVGHRISGRLVGRVGGRAGRQVGGRAVGRLVRYGDSREGTTETSSSSFCILIALHVVSLSVIHTFIQDTLH